MILRRAVSGRAQLDRDIVDALQLAVHPVADLDAVLARLDVDVAGAHLDGFGEDLVDQADDGAHLGLGDAAFGLGGVPLDLAQGLGHQAGGDVAVVARDRGAVQLLDGPHQALFARQHRLDAHLGDVADHVDGVNVARVAHGEEQAVGPDAHRQQHVGAAQVAGHQHQRLRGRRVVLQVPGVDALLHGAGLQQALLGDEAELDQDLAERLGARRCCSSACASCSAVSSRWVTSSSPSR